MENNHTLYEITQAFESLRDSLKNRKQGRGDDERLFKDLDLTLSQAMVLAWLMNHKDAVYPLEYMGQELRLEKSHLNQILNDLFATGYLEEKGDALEVTDTLYFQILDKQTQKASRMS